MSTHRTLPHLDASRDASRHTPYGDTSRADERTRLRANVLAAFLIVTLMLVGGVVADELWEASFACYAPEGGCEATDVPPPSLPSYFNH
jgi:hypothetical protein